ncbi:esterase/lipase family protein [candidate division CSSED10-310 bacterium]|uniref:Esterase/lipase family protein n=1 Tax=candidate division CSSED10-310 bacterium TaxID=2855610 RepID=A0ABV6Z6J1_UNCC1
MNRFFLISGLLFTALFVFVNCATHQPVAFKSPNGRTLPLLYLDDCDDYEQQLVELDPNREVILLVHGCKASSGRFSTLKKVVESYGQQAICFNYDYRARLEQSAARLSKAIDQLATWIGPPQITIIGHSQGGLVARRALIKEQTDPLRADIPNIRLVTISSPFNGIKASAHCGLTSLHILSAGLSVLICQGIAGAIWSEVHPRAAFINLPGTVLDAVSDHLKIVTDERGTCRRHDPSGKCVESDLVFTLEEQYHTVVDSDQRVTNVELKVGHARVVGMAEYPPYKLVEVLQKYDVIRADSAISAVEQKVILAQLYQY